MKTKSPAFLFYPNDFSSGTQFFTNEQVGKYVRLLSAQHQHGALTKQQMVMICGTHDDEVFAKFISDGNGKFYNERLQMEVIKRENYSKSRAENRTKSKSATSEIDMNNISLTHVQHMENENEIDNVKDKGTGKFKKPSHDDVAQFFTECNFDGVVQLETERFIDYYESNGWKVGRNTMKNWKSAIRNWIRNNKQFNSQNNGKQITNKHTAEQQRINDVEQLRITAINIKNAIGGGNG